MLILTIGAVIVAIIIAVAVILIIIVIIIHDVQISIEQPRKEQMPIIQPSYQPIQPVYQPIQAYQPVQPAYQPIQPYQPAQHPIYAGRSQKEKEKRFFRDIISFQPIV